MYDPFEVQQCSDCGRVRDKKGKSVCGRGEDGEMVGGARREIESAVGKWIGYENCATRDGGVDPLGFSR